MLTRDHRRIVDKLLRLPMAYGPERRRFADELTGELIRHAVAEDLYLYPALPAVVPASAVDAAHDFGNRHRHHQPERATPPAPDLHAVV